MEIYNNKSIKKQINNLILMRIWNKYQWKKKMFKMKWRINKMRKSKIILLMIRNKTRKKTRRREEEGELSNLFIKTFEGYNISKCCKSNIVII